MTPPPSDLLEFELEGMTCAACVRRVEKAIGRVPGTDAVSINLATRRGSVRLPPTDLAALRAQVEAAVTKAGYGFHPVRPPEAAERTARDEDARLRRDLLLASLLTVPCVALAMGGGHLAGAFPSAWIELALATIVLFGPGWRFFRHGIPGLLRGAPDMNALVALGAGTAWIFSALVTVVPGVRDGGRHGLYFEAAAVIVTLVLAGRLLEARARGRTGAAIRRLVGLQPPTALLDRDGTLLSVPVDQVRPGDLLRIRPGDRLPVDGVVVSGKGRVDQSMLTGEPVPVRRGPGDPVIGGTVNGTGSSFLVRAEKVGADTVLAGIIRTVEAAQAGKLPIQATVDRVTGWFVPAVLAVALLTALAWIVLGAGLGEAVVRAVSVLIIACPCAMGLATPTAILVGTGRAAELGILFRTGDALQRLEEVRTVAFDKTGTLTVGQPVLTATRTAAGFDAETLLPLLASLERLSEHPVAAAIVAAASRLPPAPPPEEFAAIPGAGVRGRVAGRALLVGTAALLRTHGVDPSELDAEAASLADGGATPFFAAVDGRAAALLGVSDPVRPTAAAALSALRRQGLHPALISGDHRRTVEAVGRALGIDTIRAEVLPASKAEAVAALQASGPVAFVGDGINDAPALAAADVGIAMGSGTDVAIESAAIVLVRPDLRLVPLARSLSRATMRNIRQNLFWAFGYNVLLIPVAAGALRPVAGLELSPMLSAAAMACSSLFVLANALRLRRFGRAPAGHTVPDADDVANPASAPFGPMETPRPA